jgi:glycine/D-amino acid oxidase-like deaminating enzyme
MAEQKHVVIIGAGIIGASLAWHLQVLGARVTVIEAAAPGGIATRHSWAWINASWGNPEPYFRLRHRSMLDWRELAQAVPDLAVNWCGGLIWDMPPDELDAYVTQHAGWGYDIRRVDHAEIKKLEPHLAQPPAIAAHVAEEGSVEPLAAAEALLRAAQKRGAKIVSPVAVQHIDRQGDRVTGVMTATGRIAADEVIIAAGLGTADLAAKAGVDLPLSAPPGLLAVTKPSAKIVNGLVMAPEMHIRQMPDGRLIAGADFGGSDPGADPQAAALALFEAMCRMFSPRAELAFDHYTLGHRPIPADDFPAVGRAPGVAGLCIAVMHSGITLAPAIGRCLAAEIITGERDPLLAPYGLERFTAR